MPPNHQRHLMTNDGRIEEGQQMTPEVRAALAMFSLQQVGEGLVTEGWTPQEEVSLYAGIAMSETERTGDRIAAAKELRRIVKEAAMLSGYVGTASYESKQVGDDGSVQRQAMTASVLRAIPAARNDDEKANVKELPHVEGCRVLEPVDTDEQEADKADEVLGGEADGEEGGMAAGGLDERGPA